MYTTKEWEDAKPLCVTFTEMIYKGGLVAKARGYHKFVKRVVDNGVGHKEIQKMNLVWDSDGRAYMAEGSKARKRDYDVWLPDRK